MHITRKNIDISFRNLVAIVSAFSVLALAAIIAFVFFQGAEPFLRPTSETIRLVPENIDKLWVDGVLYENHNTFIPLQKGIDQVSMEFQNKGETVITTFSVDYSENDPEKMLRFSHIEGAEKKYPEAYVHTLIYPGAIIGLERKIHILLPEPPYGIWKFLSGLEWRPTYKKIFGIFPMIIATLLSTLGAVLIGVPIGLLCALFLAEFLPGKIAGLIRAAVDLLAGIPSVVYGFFGLMVVVPWIKTSFHAASGSSLLAAVIILSIMILPTVISISETSLRAVPQSYREASLALGATKMQTACRVVFPAARSGILTGIILGVSRAVGETMAVILVAGNSSQLPSSLTDSVRTLTATIALEMGYAQGRHNQMLFSVGIVLFTLILLLNTIIMRLRKGVSEEQ